MNIHVYFTPERIEKLNKEATEKGYIVKEFINPNKVVYIKTSCGHVFTASPSNIRHQSRTFCKECSDLKLEKALPEKGLTLLSKITAATIKVKVDKCGHELITQSHNLYKKSGLYKCVVCIDEEFKRRCEVTKVNVVENPANIEEVKHLTHPSKYAKFIRRDCGHTFICLRYDVEKFERCRVCTQESKDKKLKENGLEKISTETNVKGIYKFLKCSHTRLLFDAAALRGNAVCHICNDTCNTNPSKIYVIEFETEDGVQFIKFGYGKSINNRIREYGVKNVKYNRTLLDVDVVTGNTARIIENSIHSELLNLKLPNGSMKKYLTRTGYSECYPISVFNEIELRINNSLAKYNKEQNE